MHTFLWPNFMKTHYPDWTTLPRFAIKRIQNTTTFRATNSHRVSSCIKFSVWFCICNVTIRYCTITYCIELIYIYVYYVTFNTDNTNMILFSLLCMNHEFSINIQIIIHLIATFRYHEPDLIMTGVVLNSKDQFTSEWRSNHIRYHWL